MILPNNTRLQNRYVIVRLLGKGGFGAVYEARHLGLGHRVALKQLILAGPQVMKAFEREARILARLKHPALPKVSDYFVDSNAYFLVMDYIEGDDFKALLAQRTTPFSVSQVLEWADQLLDALDYLHRQQPPVIHRDIKPANIKLSPAGQIYLLDFGISKGGQTHTHQAMSGQSIPAFSQHYASMEQIEGQGTDARSDLYSLAVTLHHFLSKQKPPQTVTRANALAMNRPDPLPPVNELNPQVPVGVAQVLTRALNFDPNLRPQSARAMRQMLKDAIPAPQPPPTPPIYQPPPKPPTSFPLPLLVGLGFLLLLVGLWGANQFFVEPVAGATRIAEKDGMVQVYVPEGDFEMGTTNDDSDANGDEKPRHTVYLDAFWMDQTVVTNAMFARFVEETKYQTDAEIRGSAFVWDGDWDPIKGQGANWQHPQGLESDLDGLDNYPVVQMSWNDATAYCQWAERDLPTEAQWEKTAGGVLTQEGSRKWPWGNEPPTGELVNFCDKNCKAYEWKDSETSDGYERTSPVGNYPAGASPYGALDMAGNVWEWVSDSYDSNYYRSSPRENPTGPLTTETKVLRGGPWLDSAQNIRVHRRTYHTPDNSSELWGFRCASSP